MRVSRSRTFLKDNVFSLKKITHNFYHERAYDILHIDHYNLYDNRLVILMLLATFLFIIYFKRKLNSFFSTYLCALLFLFIVLQRHKQFMMSISTFLKYLFQYWFGLYEKLHYWICWWKIHLQSLLFHGCENKNEFIVEKIFCIWGIFMFIFPTTEP